MKNAYPVVPMLDCTSATKVMLHRSHWLVHQSNPGLLVQCDSMRLCSRAHRRPENAFVHLKCPFSCLIQLWSSIQTPQFPPKTISNIRYPLHGSYHRHLISESEMLHRAIYRNRIRYGSAAGASRKWSTYPASCVCGSEYRVGNDSRWAD